MMYLEARACRMHFDGGKWLSEEMPPWIRRTENPAIRRGVGGGGWLKTYGKIGGKSSFVLVQYSNIPTLPHSQV